MAKKLKPLQRPTRKRRRWIDRLPDEKRRTLEEYARQRISGEAYTDWTMTEFVEALRAEGLVTVKYNAFDAWYRELEQDAKETQ